MAAPLLWEARLHFDWDFTEPPQVTPQQIVEIWARPGFYAELATELEVDDHEVDIHYEPGARLRVTLRLTISLSGLPAIFRAALGAGDSIVVIWSTDLRCDGEAFRGEMPARSDDGRLIFTAQTSLEQVQGGVQWSVDGPVSLDAPWLIRGIAENALGSLLKDVLGERAKVTERWLAPPDNGQPTV